MRARLAAALGALLVTSCDSAQEPSEPGLPPPRILRGPVSGAAACTGPSPSARPAEPSLAEAPGDPRQLVAAWLENPAGTVVAVSHDGGSTWSRSPLPGLLTCATGRYARTSDPWVSIGQDGVTYVAVLGVRPATAVGTAYDIVVTVSRDHGTTWEPPVVVESATAPPTQPDKEAILADPRHPATAFAVWVDYQATSGVEPTVNRVMFARTSDSGRTWSTPAAIYSGNDEAQQNQLLLTAGGVLVDVFVEGPTLPSAPHLVVREKAEAFLPTVAVAGDATIGLLWFDFRHFTRGSSALDTDVWFSTSRDRGVHWAQRRAAGPFDLRSVPRSRFGPFIGDYMGLVGLPDGFAAAFVQGKPMSRNGPTDMFFSRIAG